MAGEQVEALEKFEASAQAWLTDDDAPALAVLRLLAKELDAEPTAALAGQYGLTYRNLLRRKPPVAPEKDEAAAAMERAMGGEPPAQ